MSKPSQLSETAVRSQRLLRELPTDERSRRVRIPAWLTSATAHAVIMLLSATLLRVTPRGTGMDVSELRPAGIVLARHAATETSYFDGETTQSISATIGPSTTDVAAAVPDEATKRVDLSGDLPASVGDAQLGPPRDDHGTGGGSADAGQLAGGSRRPESVGGYTRTQVFGVTGEGSRFVYVFDRSGSMSGFGGRPLRAAQDALIRSLDDLDRVHQFQIIFYNDRTRFFSPDGSSPQLQWGDDVSKQLAGRFVRGIDAAGGTEHMRALTMALRLNPDVIFFLTDADEPQLSARDMARVERLNRGTTIHAIEFGFGPQRNTSNFLIELARRNNGTHHYVDISQLPD